MTLSGAEYGLYAGEDISINGEVAVKKDTLIESVTSAENGIAAFKADIPIGHKYYIREIKAPDKYYMSDEKFEFTYSYKTTVLMNMYFHMNFIMKKYVQRFTSIKLIKKHRIL